MAELSRSLGFWRTQKLYAEQVPIAALPFDSTEEGLACGELGDSFGFDLEGHGHGAHDSGDFLVFNNHDTAIGNHSCDHAFDGIVGRSRFGME